MNTIELIKTIEQRPGMFINVDSIESLCSFVRGFYFAKSLSRSLDDQDELFQEKFYPWLKLKYSMEGGPSWSFLIEAIASIEGIKPLDVFFREFNDFLQRHELLR